MYPLSRRFIEEDIEDGSAQHPFLIKTAEDFRLFRNSIAAGTTFAGIWHRLVNDIDVQGITYNVISSTASYQGHFDGNFKIISNFSILNTTQYNAPVFGIINGSAGGNVKRLGLFNVNISSNSYFGAYSMGNAYTNIEQCFVTGIISTNNDGGGFVGSGWGANLLIRNCYANIKVTGPGTSKGGIAGIQASSTGVIENCLAIGSVESTNNTYAGGIVGQGLNGAIKNCVAAQSSVSATQAYRINGYGRSEINNYSLNSMLVKGVTVISSNQNSAHGADATIQQLYSKAFYRDTMGWDMENIWEIDEGNGFPRLRGFNY